MRAPGTFSGNSACGQSPRAEFSTLPFFDWASATVEPRPAPRVEQDGPASPSNAGGFRTPAEGRRPHTGAAGPDKPWSRSMTSPADELPFTDGPAARGLWQPIRSVPAVRPAARVERTSRDNIRAALTYIRRRYSQPGVDYVDYPAAE